MSLRNRFVLRETPVPSARRLCRKIPSKRHGVTLLATLVTVSVVMSMCWQATRSAVLFSAARHRHELVQQGRAVLEVARIALLRDGHLPHSRTYEVALGETGTATVQLLPVTQHEKASNSQQVRLIVHLSRAPEIQVSQIVTLANTPET
ncbi:MAG: hypothetical protein KatS3mg111_1634 [Pirellulaceae bacterium]|nr:MAG: hypothetical protein KatS3mg111_1634 [Pirellulaceae bacterium]